MQAIDDRRGCAAREVPALRMLSATRADIEGRVRSFTERLRSRLDQSTLDFEVIDGESAVGGGSAPTTHPPTTLIALTHPRHSADALDLRLRQHTPPVVARILDDRLVLDLRTVAKSEEDELFDALARVLQA